MTFVETLSQPCEVLSAIYKGADLESHPSLAEGPSSSLHLTKQVRVELLVSGSRKAGAVACFGDPESAGLRVPLLGVR